LAAHALLAASKHSAQIQIGVARDRAGGFEAHAWVVCNGCVIVGGPDVRRFTPLLTFEGSSECLSS
jgi:hypothetical protein